MTAAVNKRTTETKFVSLFADSRPDVDITFKDPVLNRSTSHFVVGVDNLTVSSKALSMIEPVPNEPFIRIFRKHLQTHATVAGSSADLTDLNTKIGSAQAVAEATIAGVFTAEIASIDVINNIQQLMERLSFLASSVNNAMRTGAIGAVNNHFNAYTPAANETTEHLAFRLARNGKLVIEGTNAFWSLFCVEIPSVQNQFGLFGGEKFNVGQHEAISRRRVLTVDPENVAHKHSFSNVIRYKTAAAATYSYLFVGTINQGDDPNTSLGHGTAAMRGQDPATAVVKTRVELNGDVMQLDRRMCVELGTSLPIKNSPMVDHQKEHPDFVIGRWMFRADHSYSTRMDGTDAHYTTESSCVVEYQNSTDRVVYHELMPQNKVQVLRVKLFARVRSFDDKTEEFKNRTIDLPTGVNDWWHCRLHFVTKD